MAISFIQKALDEKDQSSTEKSLIQALIKSMGRYYPERSHKTVHASDVTKEEFCPRKIRLLDVLGLKTPDTFIPASLRATFDLGKMTADMLVEQWIVDRAFGKWVCKKCSHTLSFGRKPVGRQCAAGGNCDHGYHEIHFFSETHHISGSLDLIVDLGGQKLKVVELKIMKAEDFDKLVAPVAEHRLRTRLYLRLIEDSQNPIRLQLDTQSAKVLYVSRGFGKMNPEYGQILPFKEFDVQRDDPSIQKYLDNGSTVKIARELNAVPKNKVCPTAVCSLAKHCPVRSQCWSGVIP